jgi:hypothetical protein
LKTDYQRPTAAPIRTKKSTHHILRTRKMGHCKRSEGHKCPCDHHSLSALNTICRQTGTQSGYQQSSTHRNYISQKEEHSNLKKVSKFLHAAKSGSSSHHKIEGRRTPVERRKNMDHLVYTLPSSTSLHHPEKNENIYTQKDTCLHISSSCGLFEG